MNTRNKDRTISWMLVLIALGIILYGLGTSNNIPDFSGKTLKEILTFLVDTYLDFILIVYVFICLQVAGYVELKYKKDYIVASMLSILFTPFSLLFILKNEQDD